ncbi:MAG TPA: MMPL family transporter [Trueperaceae bacterium]|nr:MMPL family transporter [Trueperaceae bacterium]
MIAVFAVVTVALGIGLSRMAFDDSIAAMYPDNSPVTILHHQVERTFGTGKLMVAVLEGDIYTPAALTDLDRVTTALQRVQGVQRVTSLANATRMTDDQGLLRIESLVDPQHLDPQNIAGIRSFLQTSDLYGHGRLVNAQGTAASVILQIDDKASSRVVVPNIERVLAVQWPGPAHLAGGPLFEVEMHAIASRDLPLLCGLAGLLILAMLYLNFRTLSGALLPMLTVVTGLIWSMGTMGWLGARLTTLNVIGPVAILAVGSSFSLHLLGRYVYDLAMGRGKDEAIRLAVSETGLGVLISGIAIAAAMCTLVLSSMPTVRVLGLFTAGGVLTALAASLLLLPAILHLLPAPKRVPKHDAPTAISGRLRGLARFVAHNRWAIVAAAAALAACAGLGASRIVPNTAVLSYFTKDSAVRRSYDVVERTFGGASQLEVVVTGDLEDPELLRAMLAFEQGVDAIPGVGSSTSIADVIRTIHRTLSGEPGLPATRQAVAQELLVYQMSGDVGDITQLMTLDAGQGIVEITTGASSTQELHRVYNAIQHVAAGTLEGHAELGYTGLSLLQLAIEKALLHDFIVSLTLAILVVIVIDSLVRSLPAALVTILALLVTIVLQYGVLGYLGIPLDLATMLLGALAIGVGDYAIHLTVRYMEERRRGHDPEVAMERSLTTSGRSIFFTALTLGAGFAAMIVSNFVPIRTLGSLMDFTVASIGIMSLTLLPAACLIFLRNPRSPRTTHREVSKHA